MRIRYLVNPDPGDPGWKKIWIRDKHPGSATATLIFLDWISLPCYYIKRDFLCNLHPVVPRIRQEWAAARHPWRRWRTSARTSWSCCRPPQPGAPALSLPSPVTHPQFSARQPYETYKLEIKIDQLSWNTFSSSHFLIFCRKFFGTQKSKQKRFHISSCKMPRNM